MRQFYVYILASRIGDTLYIGVTNDLTRRVFEHRAKEVAGFTKRYGVTRLVHFEIYEDVESAIVREKRLKKWNRAWKVRLIEEKNPNWDDLLPALLGQPTTSDVIPAFAGMTDSGWKNLKIPRCHTGKYFVYRLDKQIRVDSNETDSDVASPE